MRRNDVGKHHVPVIIKVGKKWHINLPCLGHNSHLGISCSIGVEYERFSRRIDCKWQHCTPSINHLRVEPVHEPLEVAVEEGP